MAGEIHRITQETLDKLKAEYHELTTVGRTEIARIIESARLLGDLSENGDYHAAKDAQGKMESRIRQIDNVIRNHEIVERDENADAVEHASIVQVVYEGDGDEDFQEFFIGSIEEKPDGVLVASPDLAARLRRCSATRSATWSNTRRPRACCGSRSSACAKPWPRTLFEKIWEEHVVDPPEGEPTLLYIDLHLVHEVTSPQAFDGLRLNGRGVRRPDRTLATADHNVPTDPISTPVKRPDLATPARGARRELRGVRHHRLPSRSREPGHRPRHRTRTRRDPAGHDHRVRRLAHLHPRRLRGAGLRHRHERGRARAGHPDPPPAEGQDHVGHRRGRGPGRRHGQGHRARHRRSTSAPAAAPATCIEYRGDAITRPLDGGSHDRLQHEHRGRRARGPRRRRRHDDRLPARRRPGVPQGDAFDDRGERWRTLRRATTDADLRRARSSIEREDIVPFVTWGTNPAQVVALDGVVPSPDDFTDPDERDADRARPRPTWASTPGTPVRVDPRRRGLHRLVHELAHRGPARGRGGRARSPRRRRACAPSSCRARTA